MVVYYSVNPLPAWPVSLAPFIVLGWLVVGFVVLAYVYRGDRARNLAPGRPGHGRRRPTPRVGYAGPGVGSREADISMADLTLPAPVTLAEFDAIFEAVKNWGRWGPDDELGTLNYITPTGRGGRGPGQVGAARDDGDPDEHGRRARTTRAR